MLEACVLVIALHGAGGTGEGIRGVVGVPGVVAPSSKLPGRVWDLRSGSTSERQILSIARQSRCEKKFIVGHSNGAYLATVLLCRYPGVFDGAFAVNGWAGVSGCALSRESRLVVVHGRSDLMVPASGQLSPWLENIIPRKFWVGGRAWIRDVRESTSGHGKKSRIRWIVRDGGHASMTSA